MQVRMWKLAIAVAVIAAGCASRESQSRGTTGGTSSADTGQRPEATAQQGGAQDPLMVPGPEVKAHASDQIVSGQVTEVSSSSIVVQSGQGTKTLEVVPETYISVDGLDASRSDLEEGQSVRASYNEVDGRDVAVEIHASSERLGPGVPPGHGGMSGAGSPESTGGMGSSGEPSTGTGSTGTDPTLPPGSVPPPGSPEPVTPDGGTGSPSGPGSTGSMPR